MRKGDLRRHDLLAASEKLFFTKGYAATTINDILEYQHCTKGSFYHHFESKLQVLKILCEEHAKCSFDRYQKDAENLTDPLLKLDLLLSASLPVSEDDTDFCAMLMPLMNTPEGDEVLSSVLNAQRDIFLPELEKLLNELRESGQCFIPCNMLPGVVWDAHVGIYKQLLCLTGEHISDTVLSLLEAERYLFECVLSLPFGSVRVISASKLTLLITEAAHKAHFTESNEENHV